MHTFGGVRKSVHKEVFSRACLRRVVSPDHPDFGAPRPGRPFRRTGPPRSRGLCSDPPPRSCIPSQPPVVKSKPVLLSTLETTPPAATPTERDSRGPGRAGCGGGCGGCGGGCGGAYGGRGGRRYSIEPLDLEGRPLARRPEECARLAASQALRRRFPATATSPSRTKYVEYVPAARPEGAGVGGGGGARLAGGACARFPRWAWGPARCALGRAPREAWRRRSAAKTCTGLACIAAQSPFSRAAILTHFSRLSKGVAGSPRRAGRGSQSGRRQRQLREVRPR